MPCVYLIHFDRPFRHARHYLGWTKHDTPDKRIEKHRAGTGANLLRRLNEAGIGWHLARVWPGMTQDDERKLKKRNGSSRFCPTCKAAGAHRGPHPVCASGAAGKNSGNLS